MIEVIIPVEKYSSQLDETVASVEATVSAPLRIMCEPDLNVAECRDLAIQSSKADYICFLDYDSVMVMNGWLEAMYGAILSRPDAGAIFMGEWWGTEPYGWTPHKTLKLPLQRVQFGPSACMLVRRETVASVPWDRHIGLANGWLGGDAEEVAWQAELQYKTDCRFYRLNNWLFHHKGGKTKADVYCRSDRAKTCKTMIQLISYKYNRCPDDKDFFKDLHYLPARTDDDTMLAQGTLRDCYKDVIKNNGLTQRGRFKERGLV